MPFDYATPRSSVPSTGLPAETVIANRAAPPISSALKLQAKQSLRDWVLRARDLYLEDFPMPTISFDLRGTTAGKAYYDEYHVQLNPVLYSENVDAFFKEFIPHELAHLLSRKLYGRHIKSHGPEWQTVMRRLGVAPKRTHSLETTNSSTVRKVGGYRCGCGPIELSVRQHNRTFRGYSYTCRKCGEKVQKVGALTQAGIRLATPPQLPVKRATPPIPPVATFRGKPPTEKMLSYALALAARAKVQLPAEARIDFGACSAFIEETKNAVPVTSPEATGVPPTERQLSYAKNIATRKKLTIPSDILSNRKRMSQWISDNQ